MAARPSHSLRLRQTVLSERFVDLDSPPPCDGDDLRTPISQRPSVPVSELFLDCQTSAAQELGQRVHTQEPQRTSADPCPIPPWTGEGNGERNNISNDGRFHLVGHSYYGAAMHNLYSVVRNPAFPCSSQRIAGFEREAAVLGESRPYRGQGRPQLVVSNQHLKCVTGHYDEVELLTPIDRCGVTEAPFHIRTILRLLQHRFGGIETA